MPDGGVLANPYLALNGKCSFTTVCILGNLLTSLHLHLPRWLNRHHQIIIAKSLSHFLNFGHINIPVQFMEIYGTGEDVSSFSHTPLLLTVFP
jgi:hypothetical protein